MTNSNFGCRAFAAALFLIPAIAFPARSDYFKINVVDSATSRGIPLVQLTTAAGVDYYTDSAGVAAFREPEFLDRDVWFEVRSHGYAYPRDIFGMQGRVVHVTAGGETTITMNRNQVAERLYRITGPGIYHDTVLLEEEAPIREPLVNAGVYGQDSTQYTIYNGKIFWIWGDTTTVANPLTSNFMATGAVSDLPGKGGLDPDVGIDLDYFEKDDFTKPMVSVPTRGVYWLSSLLLVPDRDGKERFTAGYAKIRDASMITIERGLLEYNAEKEHFEVVQLDDLKSPWWPTGHIARVSDGTREWIYFPAGTEYSRSAPTYEAVRDRAGFETFSCLKAGAKFTTGTNVVDRTRDGKVRYAWRKSSEPTGWRHEKKLRDAHHITDDQRWFALIDVETGRRFQPHSNHVAWNPYRQRWTQVVSELGGSSMLGEVWYAEADRAEGPWAYCRKIITHDFQTYYNPVQHPEFAKDNGRKIYVEGTYTISFSGNKFPTPRYEYNQLMYRVDLDDDRMHLPVAIYGKRGGKWMRSDTTAADSGVTTSSLKPQDIAFYALDRPTSGAVAVAAGRNGRLVLRESGSSAEPLFWGLTERSKTNKDVVPLYADGTVGTRQGSRRQKPVCYVWRNPHSGVVLAE